MNNHLLHYFNKRQLQLTYLFIFSGMIYLCLSIFLQIHEKKNILEVQANFISRTIRSDLMNGNQYFVHQQCKALFNDMSIEEIKIERSGDIYCNEIRSSFSLFTLKTIKPIYYNSSLSQESTPTLGQLTLGINFQKQIIFYAFSILVLMLLVVLYYQTFKRTQREIKNDIIEPINALTEYMQVGTNDLSKINKKIEYLNEDNIKLLYSSYSEMIEQVISSEGHIRELSKNEAMISIAQQVAHDIRSPLAALEKINFKNASEDEVSLAKEAVKRLTGIANNLLEMGRDNSISLQEHDLNSIILSLVALKQSEFPKYNIELKLCKDVLIAYVDKVKFESVLSNLINNALEASLLHSKIVIETFQENSNYKIKIIDTGKGIPPHIFEKLGKEQLTFDKKDGNGLGLYSSFQTIQQWQGTIDLKSELNKGTTITISLPSVKLAPTINVQCILLDNDELVRLTWESQAGKKDIQLKTFAKSADLFFNIKEISTDAQFFIDSELDNEKGEDVAKKLFEMGFTNLFICSGYGEEKFKHLHFIKKSIGKEPPF